MGNVPLAALAKVRTTAPPMAPPAPQIKAFLFSSNIFVSLIAWFSLHE